MLELNSIGRGKDHPDSAPGRDISISRAHRCPASKELGITEQTFYRWLKEYGRLNLDQVKCIRTISGEAMSQLEEHKLRRSSFEVARLVSGFHGIALWWHDQVVCFVASTSGALLVLALLCLSGPARASDTVPVWSPVSSGVEYAIITFVQKPTIGDGKLHVLRIDPEIAKLGLFSVSERKGSSRTAQGWCKKEGLVAAINAGMFQQDYVSNVGYMRNGKHLNNPGWSKKYKSILAFGPRKSGLSAATIFDHDANGGNEKFDAYNTVIQNLRLLKAPGRNVWSKQAKRWSEAAIGQDKDGKILFLLCRTPLTMWDFNERLRMLPIGVIRAMHVEGGPEASLSIHGGGIDVDLGGSYETEFNENDDNSVQWPIPNVVGVYSKVKKQ